MLRTLILLFALASATPAMAYVGPGSGLGAIGIAFGFVGTLFLTLLSLIWYPMKRSYRQLRKLALRARSRREDADESIARQIRR